jgi:hypothetical protein
MSGTTEVPGFGHYGKRLQLLSVKIHITRVLQKIAAAFFRPLSPSTIFGSSANS